MVISKIGYFANYIICEYADQSKCHIQQDSEFERLRNNKTYKH